MRVHRPLRLLLIAGPGLLGVLGAPLAAQAPSEETIAFFRQNCSSCHTIGGGRLAGPDLKDAHTRASREWLQKFIRDPKAVIDSGDPYAQQLFREARGVYMQQVPGITPALVDKLIDLIAAESVAENPLFAGAELDDRPLTDADVALGAALFRGKQRFQSGAPACIGCHTVHGLGGFGGGQLGPDLTAAYGRLEGRKALGAWLLSPPSVTMQPIYGKQPLDKDERLALVAYLQRAAESGVEAATPAALPFLLSGFGSAALLLVLFDYLWRARYRGVRRLLLEGARR